MFAEAELIFILTEGGSSATRAGFWVGNIKGEKATLKWKGTVGMW